jgi:hypothetical protein
LPQLFCCFCRTESANVQTRIIGLGNYLIHILKTRDKAEIQKAFERFFLLAIIFRIAIADLQAHRLQFLRISEKHRASRCVFGLT